MKAKQHITTSLALAMLIVCATAAAHDSIYQAVKQGDVYAGRPFVDPETGLSFLRIDPPGDSTTSGTSSPTWRQAIGADNGFRQPARPCPDFSSCSSLSLSEGFEWLFGRGRILFSRTSP